MFSILIFVASIRLERNTKYSVLDRHFIHLPPISLHSLCVLIPTYFRTFPTFFPLSASWCQLYEWIWWQVFIQHVNYFYYLRFGLCLVSIHRKNNFVLFCICYPIHDDIPRISYSTRTTVYIQGRISVEAVGAYVPPPQGFGPCRP